MGSLNSRMETIEEQVSKLQDQSEKFSWKTRYERKISIRSNTYLGIGK